MKSAQHARTRPNKVAAPKPLAFVVDAAPPVFKDPPSRLLDGLTSEERKQHPVTTGVLDYFPDAIAAVAHVSYVGNLKHNPGEALHWARGKSMDHADCIARHLEQRGSLDGTIIGGVAYTISHTANLAWRALALLQEELERDKGYAAPRGATDLPPR